MFKIYPYKVGSASVKKLKTALNAVIIKTEGSKYRPKSNHLIINWGNSHRPDWAFSSNGVPDIAIFNDPESVAVASNKLLTLQTLLESDVPTVDFTSDRVTANRWLDEGSKVFIRTKLTGHSGDGIEVLDGPYEPDMTVKNAPLYTRGVFNTGEYRVHVFDGDVILYQKKSRRVDEETGEVVTAEGAEADVRNLASNWVYRTGNLNRLERVEDLALSAVQALGLDFGAVDIIKDQDGNVFVLEVNTAPGISNTETSDSYIKAFKSLL